MDKSILLFVLTLALMFTSCEKESILRSEVSDEVDWYSASFNINEQDWRSYYNRETGESYYYATVDIRSLSYQIYDGGLVNCYLYEGGAQSQLPITRYFKDDKGINWSRTIDYEYTKDEVTFFVSLSDFREEIPENMEFRVVMIW